MVELFLALAILFGTFYGVYWLVRLMEYHDRRK